MGKRAKGQEKRVGLGFDVVTYFSFRGFIQPSGGVWSTEYREGEVRVDMSF
jgi:hypothetical protein